MLSIGRSASARSTFTSQATLGVQPRNLFTHLSRNLAGAFFQVAFLDIRPLAGEKLVEAFLMFRFEQLELIFRSCSEMKMDFYPRMSILPLHSKISSLWSSAWVLSMGLP